MKLKINGLIAIYSFISLFFAFSFTAAVFSESGSPAAPFDKVERFILLEMKSSHIPGLSIGIVKDNKVVYVKGFGKADQTGRPVTPQTPFVIASVSKSFTALAIMQLVEKGKIDLDSPALDYLGLPELSGYEELTGITVRQLLNQTSGFNTFTGNKINQENGGIPITQLMKDLSKVGFGKVSGGNYQYSNTNYIILSYIVQTVSGESYAEYIDNHIFKALEMNNSYVEKISKLDGRVATGYQYWFGFPFPAKTYDLVPYLNKVSCTEDMTHYLAAIMNGGQYKNSSICSENGIKLLQSPAAKISDNKYYGMGWKIESDKGKTLIKHSGDAPGFNANIAILPDEGYGIILLENVNWMAMNGETNTIITGIENILNGKETAASPIDSPLEISLFFNVIYLVMAFFLIKSIITLRSWSKRIGKAGKKLMIPVVCINFMFSIGFLVNFPKFFSADWSLGYKNAPDLSITMIGLFSISIAIGIVKTILFIKYKGKPAETVNTLS